MKKKALGIGLFVAIVATSGILYAEDQVDCSSTTAFDYAHSYSKGDTAKWEDRGKPGTGKYRCVASICVRTMPDSRDWERIAVCK